MGSVDATFIDALLLVQEEFLTQRENRIMDLRFGLAGHDPHTLEAIAKDLGVSRERVRQLISRILRKMKYIVASKARRESSDSPCAQLVNLMKDYIQPGTPGDSERVLHLIEEHFFHLPLYNQAIPLVLNFVYEKEFVASCATKIRQILDERSKEERKSQRTEAFISWLSEAVIWPNNTKVVDARWLHGRQREVNLSLESHTGSYYSAKLGREVQFESEAEKAFLLRLEEATAVTVYQEQPIAIPYELDGATRRYFPDVFFLLADGHAVVAEIKPKYQMGLWENIVKWQALYNYCKKAGYGLLVTDGRTSIRQLRQQEVPVPYCTAVLSALSRGPITWNDYRVLREQHSPSYTTFISLILQKRLEWRLRPFRLTYRSGS